MSEYTQTKLAVENQLRSATKVRRLTAEQLGIPSEDSGVQTEDELWTVLEDAARAVSDDGGVVAAVQTEDGRVGTGIELDAGRSAPVHALELAVWKAYSESESPVTAGIVVGEDVEGMPCGRCLQVLVDFAAEVTPTLRVIDAAGEKTERVLDDLV